MQKSAVLRVILQFVIRWINL